jgi:1-acyl-sn-glycerol-3-phosphate acyltransferase
VQALRLALLAAAAWLRRAGTAAGEWLGGLRVALAFVVLSLPTWVWTLALRRPEQAWSFGGKAMRAMLRLAGVPFHVQRLERLPAGPCVLVCNHASYTDGAILVAALPRPFVFVAKGELQRQLIAGTTLRRLGTLFVERIDVARSVEDATRVAKHVRQGHSLALFPEGTFRDAPGLLPFHLGAFVAAARAGVPVVPVTITGSRTLFGGGRWWPRRASLGVEIGEPIEPPREAVDAFAAAVALRDAARQRMELAVLADAAAP